MTAVGVTPIGSLVAEYVGLMTAARRTVQLLSLTRFADAHGPGPIVIDEEVIGRWLPRIEHLAASWRAKQATNVRVFLRWAADEGRIPATAAALVPTVGADGTWQPIADDGAQRRIERHRAKLAKAADTPATGASVDALTSEWVRHRIKAVEVIPLTARNMRCHLDCFRAAFGADRTLRADRRVFDHWLESIGHLSASSRRNHTSTVRSFVRWAAVEGHIAQRAVKLVPSVKIPRAVPRAINQDQSAALVRSLADEKQRAVVGLMLWCGLRCAEVAGLNVEDVDEREGTMHVTGKGGHERIVCVPPEFAPFLSA